MFHEFGHALHGMFSNVKYPTLAGTNVPRDFVEFPSQFNEHWALEPKVFANYAKHYQTGEPMPQALVDKIKKSQQFNQGYALTEYLAAALLDMAWHTQSADSPLRDVSTFEPAALTRYNVNLPQVPPRYHSTYFSHIWGGGYSAGLLRVPVGRGHRRRCVLLVQGERRHDARERPALPRHDSVAWRNAGDGGDVPRVPRTRSDRRSAAHRARVESPGRNRFSRSAEREPGRIWEAGLPALEPAATGEAINSYDRLRASCS